MTEKELLKLKRSELLEIMLAQSREIDSLREELAEANRKLEDKRIKLKESGSIAEASLKLTRIFEEAQKAADMYVENVRRRAGRKEAALKDDPQDREVREESFIGQANNTDPDGGEVKP